MAIRSELDRNHDGHRVIDDHPLISEAHDVHTWLTYSVVIIQNKGMDRRKKDAKAAKNPRVGPENLEPRNLFLDLSLRLSSFCLPKPCYFDLWKELKQRLSFWSQDDCLSDEINMRHQSHEFRHPGCAKKSTPSP